MKNLCSLSGPRKGPSANAHRLPSWRARNIGFCLP